MKKSKGMQLGALLTAILLVSMALASAVSAESQVLANDLPGDESIVSKNKALEHAAVFMLRAVLTKTPGLEEWRGARVNPEPLTIYDINGRKLFYEFSVEKNGSMVGTMKVSASPELGSSVKTLEIGSRPWSASAAVEKAKEIARQQFDGKAEIISAQLVSYGYPKIGVMVTLVDQAGGKTRIFIDATDYSIVPDKKPGADRIGVWSIYESIPKEKKSQRITEWNRDDKYVSFVMEKANSIGIGNLTQRILSENELKSLEKQGIGVIATSSKTLNVPLYAQSNSYRCCVASAQMIAAYYGVSHTQDHIASVMGCGNTSGCNPDQELVYYKGTPPNGLGKTNSYTDYYPTFETNRYEINFDRPLRSGTPTHCRVSRGYEEYIDIWGNVVRNIYINDPYPVWIGRTYWENWNDVTHADDILVR